VKWAVVIASVVAAVDRVTKQLVVRHLELGESVAIIPGFFNLVHIRNTGAAWGILRDYNLWLAVISILTILALYIFRHWFQIHRPGSRWALGLMAGGIIGNLIDRLWHREVIDFLDFHIGRAHWPAFNVADSAICAGVALYLIVTWRPEKPAAGQADVPAASARSG
jgi:signal peptidase II